MKNRIQNLEHTIMELGAEIFKLKHNLNNIISQNQNFWELIKGLKVILEDKGIISVEDFDEVIKLENVEDPLPKQFSSLEGEHSEEMWKKKTH